MLVELHVVDLGIVADLDLVLGAGPDRDHRRDRRGQDAARRGARAARRRARRRRRWCATAPPRRGSRAASSTDDRRRGRARARRARATAAAARYVDGRLATVARARRASGARSSTCTASTRTSRCSTRRCNARALDRYAGAPALDGARRATAPRAPRSRDVDARARRARRRRARPGPRDRPAALPGRGDRRGRARRPRRGRRARGRGGAARRRGRAPRGARAARTRRSKARRSTRSAPRSPRSTAGRRSPSSPTRLRGAPGRGRRRRARAAPRGRRGRPTTRERLDAVRAPPPAAARAAAQVRRHPRRRRSPTATEVGRAARRARGLRGARRRARGRAPRPSTQRRRRPRRALLGGAPRRPPSRSRAAVEEHLHELAMPHARLEVEVEPARAAPTTAPTTSTFLLAANPGEPARPLARAASGGELSRAMLAVRVVLTEAPPTLVFDEVDAGIGGEAGTAVGRLLADARRAAPGAVRHPPRAGGGVRRHAGRGGEGRGAEPATAARRSARSRTPTVVDGDERVAELSRMLAGVGDSSHARRHAAELLDAAATVRAQVDGGADGAPAVARRGRRPTSSRASARGRPAHQGPDPAAAAGRHRGHRPQRPRPRRGRRPHRGRRRRGGERGAVDLGPVPERRARSGSSRRASRCSTTSAPSSWTDVHEGDVVRIDDGEIWRDGELLAPGRVLARAGDRSGDGGRARSAIGIELERFADNTLEYIQREARLTFEPLDAAAAAHRVRRAATRSSSCAATTTAATSPRCGRTSASTGRCSSASTAAPTRCSSIGLQARHHHRRLRLGVGDGRSHCGAELVHHVHPDGRAPGRENLRRVGRRVRGVRRRRHERRRRDAARLRVGRAADRRGGHPRHDGRVPRQGPAGHGVDVPHPAAPRARCSSTPRA